MLKQKLKNLNISNRLMVLLLTALLVGVFAGGLKIVKADSTCNSISDCQQQIANNNNAVAQLQNQATSYRDALNQVSGQIAQLEVIIHANVTQQTDLQNRINDAQAQLAQQKKTLGENIRAMYMEGDISTLEILASSKNLSQYVDKQQYRNAVSDKVKSSVDQINALKVQLQAQKSQLDALISSEKTQENQLVSAQAQQQQLLAYNQGQIDTYNSQTAQNQQKLAQLIAAQRQANSATQVGSYYFLHFPGPVTADPLYGGYPYANAGFGMSLGPGCVDNDGPDQWGYCTRQCVSYAAWAVAYSGRAAPVGWGNAADWVWHAQKAGIQFDSYPEPGDVAISTSGNWGHAMYVHSVSGNTFQSLEYNTYLRGQFHIVSRSF